MCAPALWLLKVVLTAGILSWRSACCCGAPLESVPTLLQVTLVASILAVRIRCSSGALQVFDVAPMPLWATPDCVVALTEWTTACR